LAEQLGVGERLGTAWEHLLETSVARGVKPLHVREFSMFGQERGFEEWTARFGRSLFNLFHPIHGIWIFPKMYDHY